MAKGFDSSLQTFKVGLLRLPPLQRCAFATKRRCPQEADEYFDAQRSFIVRYINMIKEARTKCQGKVKRRQALVQAYGRSGMGTSHVGHMYPAEHPVGESE